MEKNKETFGKKKGKKKNWKKIGKKIPDYI